MGVAAPTEPSSKQKSMYKKMSKLSGASFDSSFAKAMITDHKSAIAEFKHESKKKHDPAAQFAQQTLPTLQKHLDTAEKLEKSSR